MNQDKTTSPQIAIATSDDERHAIYRLRYDIHVEEMGKQIGYADHQNKILTDKLDEKATHFIVQTDEGIVAAMRGNFSDDLTLKKIKELYALDLFSDYGANTFTFSSRLVVAPEWRGHLVLARLLCTSYEYGREKGIRFNFCNCAPFLLQFYGYLGYRRFKNNITDPDVGYRIPVVLLLEDIEHLKSVRSPFQRIAKKWDNPRDTADWFHATFAEFQCFYNKRLEDTDNLWRYFGSRLHEKNIPLLNELTEDESKRFLSFGTILHCKAGETIVKEGDVGNEMFVVLSGALDVRKRIKDRSFSLGLCGAGDVFGEMSFLSQLPRSADVVALTDLEILVLTPPFLRKAVNNMPKIAAKVLLNLSIILCDRLRTSSQNWVTALSATEGKNG